MLQTDLGTSFSLKNLFSLDWAKKNNKKKTKKKKKNIEDDKAYVVSLFIKTFYCYDRNRNRIY